MPRQDRAASSASASAFGTWRPPASQNCAAVSAAPTRPEASSSARDRLTPVSEMIVSVIAAMQPLLHPLDPLADRRLVAQVGLEDQAERLALVVDEVEVGLHRAA